jgi:hypothetical protein
LGGFDTVLPKEIKPGAIAGDDGDMTTMEIVHQLISGKYPMTYKNTSFINHPGWCRISQPSTVGSVVKLPIWQLETS